ncbi:DUF1501 domain-containing protein [Blastopirellula marina]|uniref:DUF1501 domain-containing protein n=1 Tax=Blastopirellula marina TaxID=124 RepID=A0A2S8FWK8_9BACT|nr:DUF1501 domain-containing protein [Blastopirellula marina]PQO36543.1 DUF1501 domain-containing protein [Blastopirellula marina]PTL44382.1 DUF1501 domain-containing protein [Blastopirellula marina]
MHDLHALQTRRQWLARCGSGAGLLGLATLMQDEGLLAADDAAALNPLAAKQPHFPAKAKRVIWIFVNGGPSQVDTWDYKPGLDKWAGKSLKEFDGTFENTTGFFQHQVGKLMPSPFKFTPRGECGKMVSEIFPKLGEHVDKMAFIHSGFTESNNHSPALFMMNTGMARMGFPGVGSWVTYGLGSENLDLPGFVVMSDPLGRGLPKGHAANWGAAFLPGVYQGTHLRPKGSPIDNLSRPAALTDGAQRAQLDLLKQLNQQHFANHHAETELAARIESFELAYRMQSAAPEAIDISQEPEHISKLYGIDEKNCGHFAKQCLVARRMIERGVRFVQIYSGGMENQRSWDGHIDIEGNHRQFAGETDQPVAALLTDLAQRGLLEETLVIWCGEFGRLPIAQTGEKPGRDHNPHCFSAWMAGGGVKGGVSYGESDDVGYKALVDKVHVNDLHATILHLLGMDHEKLTYKYNGRRFRLTDVAGEVLHPIVA